MVEQEFYGVETLVHGRPSEGGGVVESILDVDVGALFKEELRDFGMAAVAGEEQRSGTIGRLGVHVGAFGEKGLDLREVAFARGGE